MQTQTRRSPLRSALERSGASFKPYWGWEMPAHFGDPAAEYRALREDTGMVDRSFLGRIAHHGGDAIDLLHRLTTNDLANLEPGEARPTVMASDRGRVVDVFDVVVKARDDLLLLTHGPEHSDLVEKIDYYTIVEDAELADLSAATGQITLLGPKSLQVLRSLVGDDLAGASGTWSRFEFDGAPIEVVRLDEIASPQVELVTATASLEHVWNALRETGARPVGMEPFEARRIERGFAVTGVDVDQQVNPLEAGLEALISFDKGCYIGQEVVARLDTYDKVQRHLTGLFVPEGVLPGEVLSVDERGVGRVTSVAYSPRLKRAIALGYVRRAFLEPGTKLFTASSAEAEVATLPFDE